MTAKIMLDVQLYFKHIFSFKTIYFCHIFLFRNHVIWKKTIMTPYQQTKSMNQLRSIVKHVKITLFTCENVENLIFKALSSQSWYFSCFVAAVSFKDLLISYIPWGLHRLYIPTRLPNTLQLPHGIPNKCWCYAILIYCIFHNVVSQILSSLYFLCD